MKSATFFFCLSLGMLAQAQGNLQFNQPILITNVLSTVPAGKVWKIESFTPSSAYQVHGGNPIAFQITINGDNRIVGMPAGLNYNYNSGSHSAVIHSLPIWLPAGSTLVTGTGVSMISVIEFNLVP
ncbi:MAG: hypothetical protein EB023_10300 [Flavobacteriia bacterium]|nr:hypothetical protein [Flavobacteriia bacterium]